MHNKSDIIFANFVWDFQMVTNFFLYNNFSFLFPVKLSFHFKKWQAELQIKNCLHQKEDKAKNHFCCTLQFKSMQMWKSYTRNCLQKRVFILIPFDFPIVAFKLLSRTKALIITKMEYKMFIKTIFWIKGYRKRHSFVWDSEKRFFSRYVWYFFYLIYHSEISYIILILFYYCISKY